MYKSILVATDGSELAHKGVEHGLNLAKAVGAEVVAYTATLPWRAVATGEMAIGFPEAEYNTSQAEFAADVLERVRALAETHALSVVTLHGKDSYPADGIVDTAKTHGCDLIVMASHGRRGVSRLLLGSEANQVVTRSSVPVLIVR